jgi:hypothetical protein
LRQLCVLGFRLGGLRRLIISHAGDGLCGQLEAGRITVVQAGVGHLQHLLQAPGD